MMQKRSSILATTALASFMALASVPAAGQTQPVPAPAPETDSATPPAPAPEPVEDEYLYDDEIVVVGARLPGSVIGDIPPENILDARDVRATGATNINEVLEAIAPQIGSARGRGGERPILLLNGQRISGFRELRDIPSEAIARVEVLPEEVALKYGYRADQRVVNFVLRERFRSTATRVEAKTATDGGYLGGEGEITRMMINRQQRTTLNLTAEGNSPLTEAERDIALRDPDGPDERADRTLVGSRRLIRGTGTVNRPIGSVSATLNTELEHSEGRSLLGLSDFALEPLVRKSESDSVHAGVALNGDRGKWRWSATGNGDVARSETRSDQADETFRNSSRSLRRSIEADITANGPLFKLPAGDAGATLKIGASSFGIDSERRSSIDFNESDLSRSRGGASVNIDLPVSRRNGDFSSLGNLTLNGNAGVERLSDFGSLYSVGGGLNWSPTRRLTLLASLTREEGAPSIQQLGDPVLETPGVRVFDFTRGETAEVTTITGGNAGLESDVRNVIKLGGHWRPLEDPDLNIRAEFVRSRIENPIAGFPGPSEALEAAFPDRFLRDSAGRLIQVDQRPVNYDEARRETFRWGFDFSKPLKSRTPSRSQIERLRAARGLPPRPQRASETDDQNQQQQPGQQGNAPPSGRPDAPPRPEGGDGPPPSAERGGSGGGGGRGGGGRGGFGGFGGGERGRLQLSVTHTVNLLDKVEIGEGLPTLDYLDGDAAGQSGGRPRHEVEAQAGWFNNGLGARLSANWRSGTEVNSAAGEQLRYSPLGTVDLRLFANLGEQFDLVAKHPFLRGSSIRFEISNLLNTRPRIRDAFGDTPSSFQPDLLDPLGRTVSISFRKLFMPSRRGQSRGSERR